MDKKPTPRKHYRLDNDALPRRRSQRWISPDSPEILRPENIAEYKELLLKHIMEYEASEKPNADTKTRSHYMMLCNEIGSALKIPGSLTAKTPDSLVYDTEAKTKAVADAQKKMANFLAETGCFTPRLQSEIIAMNLIIAMEWGLTHANKQNLSH